MSLRNTGDAATRLLYARKDAAQQLSISSRSLDYLIERGAIKVRHIGSRVLVPHDELVKFASRDHVEGVC